MMRTSPRIGIASRGLLFWLSSNLALFFGGAKLSYGRPRRLVLWQSVLVAASCGTGPSYATVRDGGGGVAVEDLATITHPRLINVSPDGTRVAFLAVRGIPLRNRYEATLYLRTTADSAEPEILARYFLMPQETFTGSSGLVTTACQFVWSSDSKRLLYTVHTGDQMELHVRSLDSGTDNVVLQQHARIEIDEVAAAGRGWRIKTFDVSKNTTQNDRLPKDSALLMLDGYAFASCCVNNPKDHPPTIIESWEYDWGTLEATEDFNTRVVQLLGYPEELVWTGEWVDSKSDVEATERTKIRPTLRSADNSVELLTELGLENTSVSVKSGAKLQKIYEENATLSKLCAPELGQRRDTCLSQSGGLAVLLRSTNLLPEELVKIDLTSGKVTALFSPNARLGGKTRGVRVRFMLVPVEVAGEEIPGRLYLPPGDGKVTKYPLVFAPYRSTPGFYAGSGDELPILALVDHGIAVFAFDRWGFNGHKADFTNEIKRLERPRQEMEWVVSKLAKEGVIDPARCGVSGLSYGAEIAMYSYWKSQIFRAVGAAGGTLTPANYPLNGPVSVEGLRDRGFPDPVDDLHGRWKMVSVALNARPTLPPLLLQTPDGERMQNIETWTRLRLLGAQVEWLEYPDEGHVKVGPANKWWVNTRNLDWFRFWLKDEEDPNPAKAEQYVRWREMREKYEASARHPTGDQ